MVEFVVLNVIVGGLISLFGVVVLFFLIVMLSVVDGDIEFMFVFVSIGGLDIDLD